MKEGEHKMGGYFLKYPNKNIALARRLRRDLTDAERKLWSELRRKQTGARFRRQVAFGPYILDFFSLGAKLVIEVDGSQHYAEKGRRKDKVRDAFLRGQGLRIMRFSDSDVLTNIDGVMQTIWVAVHKDL